jgi:hypothetical protein
MSLGFYVFFRVYKVLSNYMLQINIHITRSTTTHSTPISLVGEVYKLHLSQTSHSATIPWTSDHPEAETSTWQHTTATRERDFHEPSGIRTRDPSKGAAADFRLRSRSHRDRRRKWIYSSKVKEFVEALFYTKYSCFPYCPNCMNVHSLLPETCQCKDTHAATWYLSVTVNVSGY